MTWDAVKSYLVHSSDDAIDVIYNNMRQELWRKVFNWIEDKVACLRTDTGYIDPRELCFQSFIQGERAFNVTVQTSDGAYIFLGIADQDVLRTSIYAKDLQFTQSFYDFMAGIKEIATITRSTSGDLHPAFVVDPTTTDSGENS